MIRLYNTLTRSVTEFHPLSPPAVSLYTCGPTVYSTAHIGNLRTYIFEDILRRVLMGDGFNVKHIMNVTDVGHLTSDADTGEDKIEQAAREQHRDAVGIARQHESEFFRDLERLNVLPPKVILRATETIDLQIDLIKRLEAKGVTYQTADGIYFDTAKFPSYGALSRQKQSSKQAGSRVEINPEKRHPADFALWKLSPKNAKRQMEWSSPWGIGFPGWHIECSAMSMHELGDQFDIHCGGIDHIAVHHENEIAQSEAATGKHPFVTTWLHGEHLILPGKRMGKSEGNAITLDELIRRNVSPLAFRYLVLQTHYRTPLTFSWESLDGAWRGLQRLWAFVADATDPPKIGCAEFEERFIQAVDDDLNTPMAVGVMHELLRSSYPTAAKLASLQRFDEVLALDLTPDRVRPHIRALPNEAKRELDRLIAQRGAARAAGNWPLADRLRQEINALLGPYDRVLDDTPDGQEIRARRAH